MDSGTCAGHLSSQPIVNSTSLHSLPTDPFSEVLQRWYLPDWRGTRGVPSTVGHYGLARVGGVLRSFGRPMLADVRGDGGTIPT